MGGRTWASKLDENLSNEVCDNRNFVNSEDMAVNVVRDGLISEILSMFATFKSQNFILRESTESQRVAEMFLLLPTSGEDGLTNLMHCFLVICLQILKELIGALRHGGIQLLPVILLNQSLEFLMNPQVLLNPL